MRRFIAAIAAVFALALPLSAQVGTFSAPIDSLEFAPANTVKETHLERIGTTDNFVLSYYDAASDGWVCTFSCTGVGDIGAKIDSLEFAPDVTLTELSAEYADNYIALAYIEDNVGKVSTVSVSDEGAVGDAIASTYTYLASAAQTTPNIRRVTGTNFYNLIYGTETGLWVKSLSITSGTIAVVDSVRLTGNASRDFYCDTYRLANSEYFVGGGKTDHFTFSMNVSDGSLGAAAIDSTALGYTPGYHRLLYYTINDSIAKANRVYFGGIVGNTNNYIVNVTLQADVSNGDIMNSIDNCSPAVAVSYDCAAGFFIGETYFLQLARARTLQILTLNRYDAYVEGSVFASKQYGATNTSNYADMIQLSQSDSTYYVLISSAAEGDDGWLHTYSVKGGKLFAGKPGEIKPAIIDSLKISTASVGTSRSLCRIGATGTYWAMAYSGHDSKLHIKTFSCTGTGDIGDVADSLLIDTAVHGITITYAGGNYIGVAYETGTTTFLGSVEVNPSTGELGASITQMTLPGGNTISPSIFRILATNYFAVIYGIDGATTTDVGWLKTYTINNSTGEVAGSGGTTTLAAIDSLRICVSYFNTYHSLTRIAETDYYAVFGTGNASNRWTLRTIDINSTTGEIGNAWVDSLVFSETPASSSNLRARVYRMGTTNNYLVNLPSQSGPNFYTLEILTDGTIAAAPTGSFLNTAHALTTSNPMVKVGGDIYAVSGAEEGSDNYWFTFEADDTTGVFIPSSTNSFLDGFEYNYIGGVNYSESEVLSVTAGNTLYQNSYIIYENVLSGHLYVQTIRILGEPDSLGWGHKIWGITPGKINGVPSSSISTVYGH